MTVRDFPAGAPASFNGAVGKFQLNGSLDKQTVTANASDTYLLKLSGSGNLPLIQAPEARAARLVRVLRQREVDREPQP